MAIKFKITWETENKNVKLIYTLRDTSTVVLESRTIYNIYLNQ